MTLKYSTSFFAEKVAKVRSSTADAPAPTFTRAPPGVSFRQFRPLTTDDVTSAIRRLPDKTSSADPIPTSVLMKQTADVVAPFVTELFNRSLSTGHFPAAFKKAFITPIVKKPGIDATSASSYRPISNLPVLSKLLERLVVRQLMEYLSSADLIPPLQSGYRQGHALYRNCCITGALRLSDILQAVDNGDLAALVLLDMSAAVDTVDHSILLRRLHLTFGIDDAAHGWFQSYLSSRKQPERTPRAQQVVGHLSGLRRAPRIRHRANLLRPVHRRSADGDRKLRIITTHVRRRHRCTVRVVRLL